MDCDPESDLVTDTLPNWDLCVEMEIVLTESCTCPLDEIEGRITAVDQQLVDDTCLLDTMVTSPSALGQDAEEALEVVHASTALEETCPCDIFVSHGCIPRFLDAEGNRIRIETYVPDRELLADLVDGLRAIVDEFHLRRLRRVDPTASDEHLETVTLEIGELTEKQREAVTHAVARGYYETPRQITLAELAADLDISESALSQRLIAVESKLATDAFSG